MEARPLTPHPLKLLRLQLAVANGLPWQDVRWAARWQVDEDGTARCYPLRVSDVPAWVEATWDAPDAVNGSMAAE